MATTLPGFSSPLLLRVASPQADRGPPGQPGTPSEGVRCGADPGWGTGTPGGVGWCAQWGSCSPILPGPNPVGADWSSWFGPAELQSSHKAAGRAGCQTSHCPRLPPGTQRWGETLPLAFPFSAPPTRASPCAHGHPRAGRERCCWVSPVGSGCPGERGSGRGVVGAAGAAGSAWSWCRTPSSSLPVPTLLATDGLGKRECAAGQCRAALAGGDGDPDPSAGAGL